MFMLARHYADTDADYMPASFHAMPFAATLRQPMLIFACCHADFFDGAYAAMFFMIRRWLPPS